MLRIKTSSSGTNTEESTNNGMSSILMNGKENLERENSMKTSVFTLSDHSILFLNCQLEDTST